ncbi:MAG: IclR family transcriptional regulator [Jatrophihabitans sp.]|nr:MAG: IclR family transcriptional regulator [Jatrophihabitans sp.]
MVERVTLIMDCFAPGGGTLTLESVAARTALPRSTTHRILDQLVRVGWLAHTTAGYAVGQRALRLGGAQAVAEIRAAAVPLVQELSWRTGLVAHLGVLDGADVRYLDKVGGPVAAALPSRVGGRVPAHTTAIGKALLAWLAPEDVDELTAGRLERTTARSIGELPALHAELARIRLRRGVAFESEEAVPGFACVAAAVRGGEFAVAAISLCGPVGRTVLERVAPLVAGTARTISARLAGELAPAANGG